MDMGINMYMDDDEFDKWYEYEASEQERELADKVSEFEEDCFSDMLFRKGGSTYEFMKVYDADGRTAVDDFNEISCFNFSRLTYKVVPDLGDALAYFNNEEKVMCFAASALDRDSTILHEMIHAYEDFLNGLPLYFHDIVYWSLYADLKTKIPGLDKTIGEYANPSKQRLIYETGGLHDILFILKSFDLDLRMGYPLGTVIGYGVDDYMKERR